MAGDAGAGAGGLGVGVLEPWRECAGVAARWLLHVVVRCSAVGLCNVKQNLSRKLLQMRGSPASPGACRS
mgnify:CR=1 FL=1